MHNFRGHKLSEVAEPFPARIRQGYGTETALVMQVVCLWRAWEGGNASFLALLDLSAAFNITDLGMFLNCLWELKEACFAVLILLWQVQVSVSGGRRWRAQGPTCCGVPPNLTLFSPVNGESTNGFSLSACS